MLRMVSLNVISPPSNPILGLAYHCDVPEGLSDQPIEFGLFFGKASGPWPTYS